MIKPEKVVWTHAGQQNRLLERPVSTAPEEPRAQMYRKNNKKLKILLLEPFFEITKNGKQI